VILTVRKPAAGLAAAAFVFAGAIHVFAQPPATPRGQEPARGQEPGRGRGAGAPGALQGRGRGTPPQPQQKQGVDYFVGTWTFTWTGRESPITAGPREGTITFTRKGPNALEFRTEGKVEDTGAAFKESGTAEWDDAKKTMTYSETLANGTRLTGPGDWSSPLAIRYESQPAKAGNQSIRLRRTYSIVAPHSFTVTEEISIGGGPFQRLGNGVFTRQ
jgi:hypothetical protein